MAVQQGLERVDVVLGNSALRQHHDIDTVDLVPSSDNHAGHMVQIELSEGANSKKPKGSLASLCTEPSCLQAFVPGE
ncbi:MAG: hypothetical protein WBX22_31900 [Silvibacterium sp.]